MYLSTKYSCPALGDTKQHLDHFHYHVDYKLKFGITKIIVIVKVLRVFLNILITQKIDCFWCVCEEPQKLVSLI